MAGLAVAAFTSDGTVLGYTGFNHLTENRQIAANHQQTSPGTSGRTGELEISADAAVEIAQTAASGAVESLDIKQRRGRAVYDIEVGETDVIVDATDGSIVRVESDDDDDDDWTDINDRQTPVPGISFGDAIRAAEEATTGTVDEVELDYERGHLIYTVEIGKNEVIVDAADGTVLSVHADD
jgi:uncharacterized membrane protein YkoI